MTTRRMRLSTTCLLVALIIGSIACGGGPRPEPVNDEAIEGVPDAAAGEQEAGRESVPNSSREDDRVGLDFLSDGTCFADCYVVCVVGEEPTYYEHGAYIPCRRDDIRVSSEERLEIGFQVRNPNVESIHDSDRGYFEVLRYRNDRVIERYPLSKLADNPIFVRIRRQRYVADLDGDGYVEFAVVSRSYGSAIVLVAYIYSLKDQIEEWGTGRLLIENDSFVRLDCGSCSKFNPEECEKCR